MSTITVDKKVHTYLKRLDPGAAHSISDMHLGYSFISWSSTFKYLGVTFIGGKKLSVCIDVVKRKNLCIV